MSVLDRFYYMFSADTSDVDKGLKAGKKASDEMKKSLDTADKSASKLSASFMDLAKAAVSLGASVLTWSALKAMSEQSAETTNALADNARALRVDADELRTWQGVIERSGGSAAEFEGTLKNLMQRTRDPLGALERVAQRFKGLSDLRADKLGESLGLDKGTVEAMRNGSAGLQELLTKQRALGEVTKEQIDVARKFRMQQQDTNLVMDDVRRRISTSILPLLTDWLQRLQTMVMWMRDKKPFTIAFFSAIAAIIASAFVPAMIRAAAATWTLMAPMLPMILLVTAVAGAFALLVDDITAFRNGGKSMIGEISKNWPIVGEIVNELCDALGMLFEIAGAGWKLFTDMLFDPSEALRNFDKTVSRVMDKLTEKFPYLATVMRGFATMASSAAATVSGAWSIAWSIIRPILEGILAVGKMAGDIATGVVGLFTGSPKQIAPDSSKSARGAAAVPSDVSTQPDRDKRVQMIPTPAVPAPMPPADRDKRVQMIPTPAPRVIPAGPGATLAPTKVEIVRPPATESARATTQKAAAQDVVAARANVQTAAANPLTAHTSNAITNNMQRNASKQTNVTTGPITVQTQATDGAQVADALGRTLQDQIRSANDEFADGVIA